MAGLQPPTESQALRSSASVRLREPSNQTLLTADEGAGSSEAVECLLDPEGATTRATALRTTGRSCAAPTLPRFQALSTASAPRRVAHDFSEVASRQADQAQGSIRHDSVSGWDEQDTFVPQDEKYGYMRPRWAHETPDTAGLHRNYEGRLNELAYLTPIPQAGSELETSSLRHITSDLEGMALSGSEQPRTEASHLRTTTTASRMDMSDIFSPENATNINRASFMADRLPEWGSHATLSGQHIHGSLEMGLRGSHPGAPSSATAVETRILSPGMHSGNEEPRGSFRETQSQSFTEDRLQRSEQDAKGTQLVAEHNETLPVMTSTTTQNASRMYPGLEDGANSRFGHLTATDHTEERPKDVLDRSRPRHSAWRATDTSAESGHLLSRTVSMGDDRGDSMSRFRSRSGDRTVLGGPAPATECSADVSNPQLPDRDLSSTATSPDGSRSQHQALLTAGRHDFREEALRLHEKIQELEERLQHATSSHSSETRSRVTKKSLLATKNADDVITPQEIRTSIAEKAPDDGSRAEKNDAATPRSTQNPNVQRPHTHRLAGASSNHQVPAHTHQVSGENPSSLATAVVPSPRATWDRPNTGGDNLLLTPASSSAASPTISITPLLTPVEERRVTGRRPRQAINDSLKQSRPPAPTIATDRDESIGFAALPHKTLCQRLETTLRQLSELQAIVDQQFDMIARLDRERNSLNERLASAIVVPNSTQTAQRASEIQHPTKQGTDSDQQAIHWRRQYELVRHEYRLFAAEKTNALRSAQVRNERLERLVERLQQQLHEAEQDMNRARDRLASLRQENKRLRTWVLQNGLTLTPGRPAASTQVTPSP
jgi:regulator of replication initiation timing